MRKGRLAFIVMRSGKLRKVRIKIESIVTNEDECERLVSEAAGVLSEKDGQVFVLYEEPPETGLTNTKTTLKWDATRIVLLRHGEVEHRQEFVDGTEDTSLYITSYLQFSMKTVTEKIQIRNEENCWQLEIKFQSQIGDNTPTTVQLKILIEEVNAHEY